MTSTPLKFEQAPSLVQSLSYKTRFNGDFLKLGCISPDGTTLLSVSESNVVETIDLATDQLDTFKYYSDGEKQTAVSNSLLGQSSDLSVGESVYDCKWYPLRNIQDPNSNCILTTHRDHPITLWDIPVGTVRATYSGINHLDELDPATSIAFNMTGDKIYAGSNKMIRYAH